jgi:hypothetical protein
MGHRSDVIWPTLQIQQHQVDIIIERAEQDQHEVQHVIPDLFLMHVQIYFRAVLQ